MQWICHKCDSTITGYRPEHCTVCHETFNGTYAGDMHRVGDHGVKEGPMVAGVSPWTRCSPKGWPATAMDTGRKVVTCHVYMTKRLATQVSLTTVERSLDIRQPPHHH